ncbi:MAG: poly(3-hydroxybutyrate) depolymerase, partial [Planctomycetota bacterium]
MNTRTILPLALLASIFFSSSGPLPAWQGTVKKQPLERGKIQARSYFFKEADKDMGYTVYVPEAYNKKKSWPLIIGLHGLASNPSQLIRYPGFTRLAEKHGYIIACPMGYNSSAWYGAATFVSKRVGKLSEQDVM